VVVAAADQLTKWWAVRALDDRTIDLFWTLRLNLTFNRGSAFGLIRSFGPLLAIAVAVVVLVLVRAGRMVSTTPMAVGLGLVLGGAAGNLLDRAFREGSGFMGGAVVDFVDLQWWPVFNLADAAIVVGGVMVALAGRRADDAPVPP
jgi:signal peptidase II